MRFDGEDIRNFRARGGFRGRGGRADFRGRSSRLDERVYPAIGDESR